jgi:hypothetical protein
MQTFSAGSAPAPTDTKRVRWAKVLVFYQGLSGADAANDLKGIDTLRRILVKVLNAIRNHYGLS